MRRGDLEAIKVPIWKYMLKENELGEVDRRRDGSTDRK